MNMLKLKYFLDVASFMSFTKAAEHNYVSQTAVSQQIQSVETELGFKLFDRSKGKIALTAAGVSFCRDCTEILQQYEAAVSRAAKINDMESGVGRISLGFLTTADVSFMETIIRTFQASYPRIRIRLVPSSFVSIREQLEKGVLDIGFCPKFAFDESRKIERRVVLRQKMGFLVSRKNPLAQRNSVHVRELDGAATISISPEYGGRGYSEFFKARDRDGITANVVELADSGEVMRLLVSMNRGGAYLPVKTAYYDRSTCKLLNVDGSYDISETALAWCKGSETKAVQHLLELLFDFFKNDYENWRRSRGD
mgnify:CR=1 FL=1